MKSESEWFATLPKTWEVVEPDASKRAHCIICCMMCGAEHSRSKYQFKNAIFCVRCWLFEQVNQYPRVRQRVLATKSEIDELERLYALPDIRG